MKTQNVYIGQFLDPQHSAVYSSIQEAVKEIMRPMQPGMQFLIAFLPPTDDNKYYLSATGKGYGFDPRKTTLFTTSAEATKACETLAAQGFPKSQIIFKELKVHDKGPQQIDIKTEEHFRCEQEIAAFHAALDHGLAVSNFPAMMPLQWSLEDKQLIIERDRYAILDMKAANFTEADAAHLWDNVKTAAKLVAEMAQVDPDAQPNKWRRLKREAIEFGILHSVVEPDGQTELPEEIEAETIAPSPARLVDTTGKLIFEHPKMQHLSIGQTFFHHIKGQTVAYVVISIHDDAGTRQITVTQRY